MWFYIVRCLALCFAVKGHLNLCGGLGVSHVLQPHMFLAAQLVWGPLGQYGFLCTCLATICLFGAPKMDPILAFAARIGVGGLQLFMSCSLICLAAHLDWGPLGPNRLFACKTHHCKTHHCKTANSTARHRDMHSDSHFSIAMPSLKEMYSH